MLDLILIKLHLVHETPVKEIPSLALLCLTQSKNVPSIYRGILKNLAPTALQSKLANVELSDLGAESIHTEYAVCPTTPTSYCCVCMAELVMLKWVFPP